MKILGCATLKGTKAVKTYTKKQADIQTVTGTPIPLDTHPPEHSSPWNTCPPGNPIPLEHSSPWNSHPPGTLIPLELPSPWNTHPPGTLIPLELPSPLHGTLIPPLIFLILYTH